jgi:predicted alpha/beta-fold hydrolase
MSHGVFTLDDVNGFCLPLVIILGLFGCCVYSIFAMVRWIAVRLLAKKQEQQEDHDSASSSSSSTTASCSRDWRGILIVLVLSYCLAPLVSQIHLIGKRHNQSLTFYDDGLFDLVTGQDAKLQEVLAKMSPSLLRGPRPPWLFANRHLQFLPWLLQNEVHRLEEIPFQTIQINVTACADKGARDKEYCHAHASLQMTDTVTIDVFPPFENDDSSQLLYPNFDRSSPIILFNPGLRCYSQDMPGTSIIRRAYGAGFRSVVLNRRGHAWPPRKLRAPRWNLFGDVHDLEQVYWFLFQQGHADVETTPLFLHGISSGTALVVSALAEWDQRNLAHDEYQQQQQHHVANRTAGAYNSTVTQRLPQSSPSQQQHPYRRPAPTFVASVSVTPGYDISRVLLTERFKNPYNYIMTQAVQDHFVRYNEDLLRDYNSPAVDAVLQAKTLQDLLNAAVPFAGYATVDAYYQGENPVHELQHISTPKLVLNSIDDPCCNIHNVYETSPYAQHDGKSYAQIIAASQRAILAVTRSGSHCPFLDTSASTGGQSSIMNPFSYLFPAMIRDPFNGGWMLDSWADRVAIEFYLAALEVYGHERRARHHNR